MDLQKLQKLACLKLDPASETAINASLEEIITMMEAVVSLGNINANVSAPENAEKLTQIQNDFDVLGDKADKAAPIYPAPHFVNMQSTGTSNSSEASVNTHFNAPVSVDALRVSKDTPMVPEVLSFAEMEDKKVLPLQDGYFLAPKAIKK